MDLLNERMATPASAPEGIYVGDVELLGLGDRFAGRLRRNYVNYRNGARTAWHTHDGEQLIIFLDGEGAVGNLEVTYLCGPGDVVHVKIGEVHWHGARPGRAARHFNVFDGTETVLAQVAVALRWPPGP